GRSSKRWEKLFYLSIVVLMLLVTCYSAYQSSRHVFLLRNGHLSRPLGMAFQHGSRRMRYGYGPQRIICTLGELSRATKATFPQDGLCDVLVYAHLDTVTDVKKQASPNLRTFWVMSKKTNTTKFGYSFSDGILSSRLGQIKTFVSRSARKDNIGAFGMLSTVWTNGTDARPLVKVMRALDASRYRLSLAKPSINVIILFGITLSNYTRLNGEKFLLQHRAVLKHVQMLVYETHSELARLKPGGENSSAIKKRSCISGFPTPRFFQTMNQEPTLQDAVYAMDTLLHFKGKLRSDFAIQKTMQFSFGRSLGYDVCASITLSAHRYRMHNTVDINSACKNVSAASYSATCNPNEAEPAKVDREGIVVVYPRSRLLDVFDAPETIVEKLKSVKASLLLAAPQWSFCVAAFHIEHEDHQGTCGPKFGRLLVTKSYLQGKLR
ncbi:unnamed protein product, partial [Ixodes hexagonus]